MLSRLDEEISVRWTTMARRFHFGSQQWATICCADTESIVDIITLRLPRKAAHDCVSRTMCAPEACRQGSDATGGK